MFDFVLILSSLYCLPFSDLALILVCAREKTKNFILKLVTYITLQNFQFNPFQQLKVGATLTLQLFSVCVLTTTKKLDPESWCKMLSIKQLRMREKEFPKSTSHDHDFRAI